MAQLEQPQYKYKVQYFPFGGRAQCIRAAFYLGDIPYEDEFIDFNTLKKMQDTNDVEWTGIPMLVITDNNHKFRVGQSNAILTYVGKLSNLTPKDNIQALLSDEILNAAEDMATLVGATNVKDEQEKKQKREELLKGRLKIFFDRFDEKLKKKIYEQYGDDKDKNCYFVGNSLTVADLKMYFIFSGIRGGNWDYVPKNVLDQYKYIINFIETVESNKKLMEFVKKFNEKKQKYDEEENKKKTRQIKDF